MILLILRGVPASGKSTHAEELQKQGWTVVNRDSIRFALYGQYWGKGIDESVVTVVEDAAIDAGLRSGANVVVDATNLNAKALKTKLSLASRHGAMVSYRDFPVKLWEATERDARRERQVGEKVIRSFFSRYKIDVLTGALPRQIDPWPKFEPYVGNLDKPMAYIVDTDGTVANHEGVRDPYDTTKYHLDAQRFAVVRVVRELYNGGFAIIGLSGRDDSFREVTTNWWKDMGIPYTEFYMRRAEDRRVDAVVKYELFKEYIEPNWDVVAAFDDRPQVIRMWETIGVDVFDVGNRIEF